MASEMVLGDNAKPIHVLDRLVAVVPPQIVELNNRPLSQRYLNPRRKLDSIPQILAKVIEGFGRRIRGYLYASDFEVALYHEAVPVSSREDPVDPAKVPSAPIAQQYVPWKRIARGAFEDNPVFPIVAS